MAPTTSQQVELGARLLYFADSIRGSTVTLVADTGETHLVLTEELRAVAMTLISQGDLKRLLGGRGA